MLAQVAPYVALALIAICSLLWVCTRKQYVPDNSPKPVDKSTFPITVSRFDNIK